MKFTKLTSKLPYIKKIYQTINYPNGNCLPACIASITHLELNQIPNLANKCLDWNSMKIELNKFLKKYNLQLVTIYYDKIHKKKIIPKQPYIVIGNHREFPIWSHAVVAYKDKIIHEPSFNDRNLPDKERCDRFLKDYYIREHVILRRLKK